MDRRLEGGSPSQLGRLSTSLKPLRLEREIKNYPNTPYTARHRYTPAAWKAAILSQLRPDAAALDTATLPPPLPAALLSHLGRVKVTAYASAMLTLLDYGGSRLSVKSLIDLQFPLSQRGLEPLDLSERKT